MKPKRVVVLIADDWSPIAGCYGDPVVQTPNIDPLAVQGTMFRRAYCASPSCGPSRATLLTGLHSYAHGQYGHPHGINAFRLRTDVATLPGLLRGAGVFTGSIGKRHIEPVSACGYDYVLEDKLSQSLEECEAEIDAFLEQAGTRDYFLYMGSTLPHRTARGFDSPVFDSLGRTDYDPDRVPVPSFMGDLPGVRSDLADYYTAVSRFDAWVGKMLDRFRAADHFEGTLFLVMSDHGMPFAGAKASPFEGGHRCPLIVAAPGILPAGAETETLVSWTDVAPTVLDWFGVPAPDPCHGTSFLANDGPGTETRKEIYLSQMFHGVTEYYPYRVLARDRFKLVHRLEPSLVMPLPGDLQRSDSFHAMCANPAEGFGTRGIRQTFLPGGDSLFDLKEDPGETRNLMSEPDFAEILEEMQAALHSHREATEDPLLRKDHQRVLLERLLKET